MKIIVVGAGIVGTSSAYSLLKRGHQVTLIEAKHPASGTTSTSYAWINSHKKHPESYHALNFEGLKYWTNTLAPAYPDVVQLPGHVETAVEEEHRDTLRQRVTRLQSLNYAAEWLSPSEARKLRPMKVGEDALAAHFPWEGHAYPQRLVELWIHSMQENPQFSLVQEPVARLSAEQAIVVTENGQQLRADRVVLAVGNATTELAATAGVHLPMVPRKAGGAAYGYLGYVEAPAHAIQGPITTDRLNIRPNGDDGLILQALDLDGTADPDQTPATEIGDEMLARLHALTPQLQATLQEVRAGYRVIPGDGLTVAGPAGPGLDAPLWITVTHSGVVLGPWLGEVVAEEITTGEPNPLLEEFRPLRFQHHEPQPEYEAPRRAGDQ